MAIIPDKVWFLLVTMHTGIRDEFKKNPPGISLIPLSP
jgi:hypothetical protein